VDDKEKKELILIHYNMLLMWRLTRDRTGRERWSDGDRKIGTALSRSEQRTYKWGEDEVAHKKDKEQ